MASFRLFKPVRSEPLHDNNRKFPNIPFANKGIDAINISNILNRKEVVKEIPPYFKNQSYYFECLIKELGINNNTSSNTTYKPTSFDKDEILANHRSFMTSLSILSGKESEDLPYLYIGYLNSIRHHAKKGT